MTSGSFADQEIQETLLRMSERHVGGTLIVQGQGQVLTVSFERGQIVSADLNEPFQEGLGQVLVGEGVLSPEQLREVSGAELRMQSEWVKHLVDQGLVSAEDVSRGLRVYVHMLLVRLLRWESGEFKLYEAESPGGARGFQPISVEELLVRASEENVGTLPAVVPELDAKVYRRMSDPEALAAADGSEVPSVAAGRLSGLEARVLKLMDGRGPASGYVEQLGTDQYRVRLALHRLLMYGLAEPSGLSVEEDADPRGDTRLAEEPSVQTRDPGPATDTDGSAGQEDVLLPPLSVPLEPPRPRRALRPSELRGLFTGIYVGWTYCLAAGWGLLLVGGLLTGSGSRMVLFPFPWQQIRRAEMESSQRTAIDAKLERAVTTHYLLAGRLPRDLTQLVDEHLLSSADLFDPSGRWLELVPVEDGFKVEPMDSGEMHPEDGTRFETTLNFLDPSFAGGLDELLEHPLVLLD